MFQGTLKYDLFPLNSNPKAIILVTHSKINIEVVKISKYIITLVIGALGLFKGLSNAKITELTNIANIIK
jgi:hypothetical protein